MKKLNLTLSANFTKYVAYSISFLLATIVITALSETSRGEDATNKIYDVVRTTGNRDEVVILGIDDKSLQALGAWPWDRSVFADVQSALTKSNVRMSVYDVLFFEPRAGDEDFKDALLKSARPIVLASKQEGNTYLSSYLAGSSTTILSALANVSPDSDGKVRRYAESSTTKGVCIPSLSGIAFTLYTLQEASCDTVNMLFRYPAAITTYSLIDVVRGEIPESSLKGKVVFIGSTSLDLEDHFVGMGGNKVPGVYVHASMFASLLNRIHDTPISVPANVLLFISTTLISLYIVYRQKSVILQVISLTGIILLFAVVSVLLYDKGYILPLPWLIADLLIISGIATLIRILRERKQNEEVQSLFSKYVHKDVLKELMASGKEIRLGGERKQLSILFSDIRGFTTLSETLSPEELTGTLNEYLSAMTPIILEEKGTIDKFIGDAIMAFWNAPLDVENHSLHAVRSALAMHHRLETFNTMHGTSLAMGIGVHTGNVIVGNVGGKDRVNYTVLGDAVNLASRIEGLTKKYGVSTIVTKAVRDLIDDPAIRFRCLDVITVVGKSLPTTLYEARYVADFSETTIAEYEKAFTYYYDKEWNKAESLFKKLSKAGDAPSGKLLARIPELRKRTDWDGVWRFDEK
jgi:adenylate cyclase